MIKGEKRTQWTINEMLHQTVLFCYLRHSTTIHICRWRMDDSREMKDKEGTNESRNVEIKIKSHIEHDRVYEKREGNWQINKTKKNMLNKSRFVRFALIKLDSRTIEAINWAFLCLKLFFSSLNIHLARERLEWTYVSGSDKHSIMQLCGWEKGQLR